MLTCACAQICNAGADVKVKDLDGNTPLVRPPRCVPLAAVCALLTLGMRADAGWQEQRTEEGGHD